MVLPSQPTPVGESHATTGAPIATDWACAAHGAMAKSPSANAHTVSRNLLILTLHLQPIGLIGT